MKLRKSRLNLAVGAVLGAATLIPATSFGWSVDTAAVPGTLLTASGGDTLLFPIYSTVNPVTTSFSVTNTSGVQTIAAKIRFREQDKSMDVLDFIVVLSPYDKFDFSVAQGADDLRPTMSWSDNSCLVGPGVGTSVQFPPPSAFVANNETMSVGHLEVLGMGDLTNAWVTSQGVATASTTVGAISLAAAAKHDATGVPANCGILRTVLSSPANVQALRAFDPPAIASVDNVLVGRYVITGVGLGIEAGGDAIGIRDSDFETAFSAQSSALCSAVLPTTIPNCAGTYAWDTREWDHPHLAEMANLDGFQQALTAANISGDWSNNPTNDVGVDWVLSFPNKYAYLDLVSPTSTINTCGLIPVIAPTWCLLADTRSGQGGTQLWTASDTPDLCIRPAELSVWDREEQPASGSVTVSPGAETQLELCHELEVFTLAASGDQVRESVIQVPESRRIISFENLEAIRGWAKVTVPWAILGDSISGILFTSRNTDNPTINNASLTDLQKDVGRTP